jgi:hypothetical protein
LQSKLTLKEAEIKGLCLALLRKFFVGNGEIALFMDLFILTDDY